MGETRNSRRVGPGRETWTALACAALIAGCGSRDRASGPADSAGSKAIAAVQAPASAESTSAARTDTGRAGEIARAPRANPNAPPESRPTLRPDTGGQGAPPPELHDKYHPAPLDTVSQVVYTGWKYFNLNCARCHGEDVTGTTIAPHLIDSFRSGKVDHDEFWRVVHGSRVAKGMPNWSGVIPDDKLEAIFQYVKGRSEGKLHPGRPAVKQG